MQIELAHANRVATMGQLTASIAHEINQPITATVTNAEAALRWLRAGPSHLDEVQQSLTNIVEDGIRLAVLRHQRLAEALLCRPVVSHPYFAE
jgi:C4-dicarboxylate-specific signal transduction histidine kinase